MSDFIVKEVNSTNIEQELEKVGFDKVYLKKAVDKYQYKNIPIQNILIFFLAHIHFQTLISDFPPAFLMLLNFYKFSFFFFLPFIFGFFSMYSVNTMPLGLGFLIKFPMKLWLYP